MGGDFVLTAWAVLLRSLCCGFPLLLTSYRARAEKRIWNWAFASRGSLLHTLTYVKLYFMWEKRGNVEEIPLHVKHVKIKVKFGIKEATCDFICMCYSSTCKWRIWLQLWCLLFKPLEAREEKKTTSRLTHTWSFHDTFRNWQPLIRALKGRVGVGEGVGVGVSVWSRLTYFSWHLISQVSTSSVAVQAFEVMFGVTLVYMHK